MIVKFVRGIGLMIYFVGDLDLFVYDEHCVLYVCTCVMYMFVMSLCIMPYQIVMHVMSLC
jgi:hypothetical protein